MKYKLIEDGEIIKIAEFDDANTAAMLGYVALSADDIARQVDAFYTITWDDIRSKRNELLAETDYWALSDVAAMTSAQTNYRQNLRDITEDYATVADVRFPTKP